MGKEVNGQVEYYLVYADQLNPILQLDATGAVTAQFVYGTKVNVPDYMIKDGHMYRVLSDHLGSVRMIVDDVTGQVAQRIDYDPWGKVLQDTNPGFQPFGFAGGLYDPDTTLVRFGARDYDAETGRWTSKDPIGFGGSINFFMYSSDDPIDLLDLTGYCSEAFEYYAKWGGEIAFGAVLLLAGVEALVALAGAVAYNVGQAIADRTDLDETIAGAMIEKDKKNFAILDKLICTKGSDSGCLSYMEALTIKRIINPWMSDSGLQYGPYDDPSIPWGENPGPVESFWK